MLTLQSLSLPTPNPWQRPALTTRRLPAGHSSVPGATGGGWGPHACPRRLYGAPPHSSPPAGTAGARRGVCVFIYIYTQQQGSAEELCTLLKLHLHSSAGIVSNRNILEGLKWEKV